MNFSQLTRKELRKYIAFLGERLMDFDVQYGDLDWPRMKDYQAVRQEFTAACEEQVHRIHPLPPV